MYLVATYYMIEKHREALLWSFLVAAADEDGSGSYSYEERANMRQKIRATTKNGYLHVDEPDRPGTYNRAAYYSDRLEDAHTKRPKETVYVWSSQDGYPFLGPAKKTFRELTGVQTSFCHMPVERCFGHRDFFDEESSGEATFTRHLSPEELFKNMAFRNTGCGDCLIASLLSASGSHGLSAFLPEAEPIYRRQRPSIDQTEVPVIGNMSRDWESADFSLATSLRGEWQARDFAVRLLQRYSYTLGNH